MEKQPFQPVSTGVRRDRGSRKTRPFHIVLALPFVVLLGLVGRVSLFSDVPRTSTIPINASQILQQCSDLYRVPGPSPDFPKRTQSDRLQPGTKPVLIRNATIWTGHVEGLETLFGDILLADGLIKAVGEVDAAHLAAYEDLATVDAQGAWVSPGIIDVHSHLGVEASPHLEGAADGNSFQGTMAPWMRSLDGLNTHDEGLRLGVAGGLTTSLILPGSADAIGGQAFVIKLRPTTEKSPTSFLLEPPSDLGNGTHLPPTHLAWKHMKHACGENPSRFYGVTRMDSVWAWREAYNTAKKVKTAQDDYCLRAEAGNWDNLGSFREDFQWQPLIDILRGKVKVQTHCYEAVDFDNFVRLSNEFEFPVAAFHHAHEAYLVPDVLKRAYGPTPAVAIFSTFSGYKRESYRSSEYAAKVLAEAGIRSDHPAIVSRYLVHEAQVAHHYGLPTYLALSAVTTTAAGVLGLDHRIGFLKIGYDADVVIWDSHPLALGATPRQVFIDGIPQIEKPYGWAKLAESQSAPKTPDYDAEAAEALKHDGLPPLQEFSATTADRVVFANVSSVWVRNEDGVEELTGAKDLGFVTVEGGRIVGTGKDAAYVEALSQPSTHLVDLQGGSIAPAIVSTGTSLGLQEISMEASTTDGAVFDPLQDDASSILGNTLIRAVDGLQFATRDALLAYRAGVTSSVTFPEGGFLSGLGVSFSLVHVTLNHLEIASVSTQIAALRHLLLDRLKGDAGIWFGKVALGLMPLVVRVHSADIIATLLELKAEVEDLTGAALKLTLLGATEAHLLADAISAADVGVIVPPRTYPYTWDDRRIMAGHPLTETSLVPYLLDHGIKVGIAPQGIDDFSPGMAAWSARKLRWDAGWVAVEGNLTEQEIYPLVSTNIDKLLGVRANPAHGDLVATRGGGLLSFEGKVVAIISPRRGSVDII
ncbi:composite domain of metallo-dependent hydrolase [Artomyces pyxidatus]|uniref:Composite domain of metallo-dependent hydrolase n=1 Tax=Artomyces pyxidatus TaxID=48021 RepID=A0ACB8T358_9AGAM|nr:composite domain of metallo-dependent hydrolase [Artomyces pyxidatus]